MTILSFILPSVYVTALLLLLNVVQLGLVVDNIIFYIIHIYVTGLILLLNVGQLGLVYDNDSIIFYIIQYVCSSSDPAPECCTTWSDICQ